MALARQSVASGSASENEQLQFFIVSAPELSPFRTRRGYAAKIKLRGFTVNLESSVRRCPAIGRHVFEIRPISRLSSLPCKALRNTLD
jgi:hypothetical protein